MDVQELEPAGPPEGEAPSELVDVPLSHLMLHTLTPRQVQMIDDALRDVGLYGEVRLVVQRGRLRFIEKLESLDATKGWQSRRGQPGADVLLWSGPGFFHVRLLSPVRGERVSRGPCPRDTARCHAS